MPLYTLTNDETNETWQEWMSKEEIDLFLQENPSCYIDFSSAGPGLHSGIGLGVRKPDENFKDLLGEMKKAHNKRGGKINDHR
jgi:hypothetical protein